MNIKIECACGTKYGFEVEPVHGRMPVNVQCPDCKADGTESANRIIQAQLGSSRPTSGPIRVKVGAPEPKESPSTPLPAEPVVEPLAASPASEPLPETPQPDKEYCPRHSGVAATAHCAVCGKPICPRCQELFGYLCSVYCQEQAVKKNIDVPVFAGQRSLVEAGQRTKTRRSLTLSGVAALLALAGWLYLAFVASKPHPAFTLETGADQPFLYARWVGSDRVVAMTGQRISLYDAATGDQVWTAALKTDEQIRQKADDAVGSSASVSGVYLKVAGEDIWIVLPSRVVRYDARTGKREQEISLAQRTDRIITSDSAILTIAGAGTDRHAVTFVDLESRKAQSETFQTSSARRVAVPGAGGGKVAPLRAMDAARAVKEDEPEPELDLKDNINAFLPAGPNVAHMAVNLLKARIVTREVAQAEKESVLDKSNLRAGDSDAATKEFLRSESGGGPIDESRYRVTLRRVFGGGLASWSGEVVGPPAFFPLKTVDVLTAGKTLMVFNKDNRQLWEAKLTYPVAVQYNQEPEAGFSPPCFEAGNRLYFHDQGMLTVFDLKSGHVQWRLTSVGISQAELDEHGRLYISSTTASPESIPTSADIKYINGVQPTILQVDTGTGRILWQKPYIGERFNLSGKFVYVSRAQVSGVEIAAAAMNDTHAPTHHRIYRLDPETGAELWQFYRPKPPVFLDARKNRLLLQYRTEIRMLKFLAF